MVLVKKFEHMPKEHTSIHNPVECGYTVFIGSDGAKYLQLDTYGSQTRQVRGKVSQSLQFDAESAAALKRLIESELL